MIMKLAAVWPAPRSGAAALNSPIETFPYLILTPSLRPGTVIKPILQRGKLKLEGSCILTKVTGF